MRFVVFAAFVAGCSHGRVEPVEPRANPPRDNTHVDAAGTPPPQGAVPPDATAVTPPSPPAKVKIMVRTTPKAWVYWGKKKLGLTPLNIDRPRDSGPVDLVLRADGYFPMHTRAYTVKNDVIGVKMVKLADRMTVFGAKAELPPDEPVADPLDPANAPKPPATP